MPDLAAMLSGGRVHVGDGAMGTMLYQGGVFVNVCYDELNATRPTLVEDVHERYIRAGAELIQTNTFGANPVKLSWHGLEGRTEELNRRAAEIAVRTADERAAVAGAIGPLGVRIEPLGPMSRAEARAAFGRQVDGLLEGGAGGFVIETFSDISELEQAFRAVRDRCDLPVVVQMTVDRACATEHGTTVEQFARAAADWGVDAVGLNCSVGPAAILEGLERMGAVTSLPLSAMPNAGLPSAIGDRRIYLTGPDYMAQYARRLIDAGARLVAGCCGTTPEHIRRMRDELAAVQPRSASVRIVRDPAGGAARPPPTPLRNRSRLGRLLADGEFALSARITPPRGWDASARLEDCRALAAAGAQVIAVREVRGAGRMGAAGMAARIATGPVEPVLHYTCRGRALPDMISDLLGAAAMGVHNVVLVTGQAGVERVGPEFRSSVDVDAIGLVNVATGLNRGVDPSGNAIGAPAGLVTGTALRQGAPDRARELGRLAWKVDAGACFAVSEPVFDVAHLLQFLDDAAGAGAALPVLAAVRPLASAREAEFLRNEVPGMRVPQSVVERMRRAAARGEERAAAEGIAIARETVDAFRHEGADARVAVAGVEVVVAGSAGVAAAAAVLDATPRP